MTSQHKIIKKIPPRYLLNPIHCCSLGFGSGLMPKAPGTFGTIAAIPIYMLLSTFSITVYLTVTLVFMFVGFALCGYTSRKLEVHDHPGIVWDEIVGYLITMAFVPYNWAWLLIGFIWFRLFDILKPWPIRYLDQHVSGGFGIMIDDVLAGLFALASLHVTIYCYQTI